MAIFLGISFPFRRGATSFPEVSTDDALIKESLIQIVLTGAGERVMRSTFGSNLYRYIFEPNGQILAAMIQTELQQTITKFEPRVSLVGIDVTRGTDDTENAAATVKITINYIVLSTNSFGSVNVTLSTPGGT